MATITMQARTGSALLRVPRCNRRPACRSEPVTPPAGDVADVEVRRDEPGQVVGARTYGQYFPIARASELLAERWSIIILLNIILVGCRTFNEIAGGTPGLSQV
jgi:hypothetical protein